MPVRHNSLEALGRIAGTDKSTIEHGFLDFYERELHAFRGSSFTLIEIGVKLGASLRMWASWFPFATIVGLDLDESAADVPHLSNANIRIGNAADLSFLDAVVTEFGAPTIVIDDGSHVWPHQLTSLRYFLPKVISGGCFILEDIHTSFPSLAEDYRFGGKTNPFDYIQNLTRWVVGNRFMGEEVPNDDFIAAAWPIVSSVHFFRGTCVIHRS